MSECGPPRDPEPPLAEHCRHGSPHTDRATPNYKYIYESSIIIEELRQLHCAENGPHQDKNESTGMTFNTNDRAGRPNTNKRDVDPGIAEGQYGDDANNISTHKGCLQEELGNRRSRVPPDQATFGTSRETVQQNFSASHNALDSNRINIVGHHNVRETLQDNVAGNGSTQEGIRQGNGADHNTLNGNEQRIEGNGNVQRIHQRCFAGGHTGQSNAQLNIYVNHNVPSGVPEGGAWMWPCCLCAIVVIVHGPRWFYTKSPI